MVVVTSAWLAVWFPLKLVHGSRDPNPHPNPLPNLGEGTSPLRCARTTGPWIPLRKLTLALAVMFLTLSACEGDGDEATILVVGRHIGIEVTSTAFAEGSDIPARFTCDDADVSPPLQWTGVPQETKSLALIVDDPDAPDPKAPQMTWVHWVLYNLPPTAGELPEGVKAKALPPGTREGQNDWKRPGYGGPCPPIGRHRYFHKLYALDVLLPDLETPTKAELEKAMEGHVLARTELVGTYQKEQR